VYELLGICLVAASLLTINAIASAATAACSLLLRRRCRTAQLGRARDSFRPARQPPALALISVTLFLVPSYVGYEPYTTSEIVSKKLAALAILSAIGVTLALSRALRSWFATRTLLQEWLSSAVQIKLDGTGIPTFRIANLFRYCRRGAHSSRAFLSPKACWKHSARKN